jgi:RNA polymerase sigma-70 factor, ECF subfamily
VPPQQFTDLIRQNRKLIHKIARVYCRDSTDRDDVVQEIVVQLWRSRDRYDDRFALSTWIYRIALNVAISFFRRERRHREHRQNDTEHLISIPAEHLVDHDVERNEDLETLHRCIDELDALNKALVLLYLDGKDYASIADILGITLTNVATKLSRIKKTLKRAFEERDDPNSRR